MVELITLSIFVGGLVFGALVSGVLSKRYAGLHRCLFVGNPMNQNMLLKLQK